MLREKAVSEYNLKKQKKEKSFIHNPYPVIPLLYIPTKDKHMIYFKKGVTLQKKLQLPIYASSNTKISASNSNQRKYSEALPKIQDNDNAICVTKSQNEPIMYKQMLKIYSTPLIPLFGQKSKKSRSIFMASNNNKPEQNFRRQINSNEFKNFLKQMKEDALLKLQNL